MKKRILRFSIVLTLGILIALTAYKQGLFAGFFNPGTARANGDIVYDIGVASGQPIFTIINAYPGDSWSRSINVTNNAVSKRLLAVRSVEATHSGDIRDVLFITISQGSTYLYGGTSTAGPKTLSDFFIDSLDTDGVILTELGAGDTTQFNINVVFDESAGNEYQGSSVVFDLLFGISIKPPDECKDMNLSGPAIYGTSKRDRIFGTSGNDLIYALEGRDIVYGQGGDDCIVGGADRDLLYGRDGDDVILGNEQNDILYGENGNDKLYGHEGNDVLYGGDGNDIAYGHEGKDVLDGGNGNDYLEAGLERDVARGKAGIDECYALVKQTCELP